LLVLTAELIADVSALDALRPGWDALALASRQPLSSPAWMLAWLQHAAPADVAVRVVAVYEGDSLIGIAPFFIQADRRGRVDYRLMGEANPRTSPLAVPGREWDVAAAIANVFAEATPRPDVVALECLSVTSQWPIALRDSWPGRVRPIMRQYFVKSSPTVSLTAGSFDTWLGTRRRKFRAEMRRRRRRFSELGGSSRLSTHETLDADIRTFIHLHAARWEERGSSSIVAMGERMPAMLEEVARAELDAGRFRLSLLEIEGEPVSAQLCAAAGGEVLFINAGWDERFAQLSPALLAKLYAIDDAFTRGEERIDLAPGEQPYKLSLADGDDPVAWTILMVPSRRLPLTYVRSVPTLASRRMRDVAKRALPAEWVDRLRAMRQRLRSRKG
jgi:CelD/BcsL family acetyltransferase involved in cellulose biosynthesis